MASPAVAASMPISPANKARPATLPSAFASAGFTLLEIMLVMALVAGAMLMVAAALTRSGDGTRLRTSVAQIANGLRDTRAQALMSQQVQRFVINSEAHQWQASGRTPQQVHTAIYIDASTAAELRTERGEVIAFFPDGASSGGRIVLSQGGQSWQLDVNWLTGRVDTSRVPAP